MKKLTHEYVYNYYKDNGYIMKSIYKSMKYTDDLICPNGHNLKINFNNFKDKKVRCKECYFNNRTGVNHPNWNEDRTLKRRRDCLKFNYKHIYILSDDPNYQDYLINTDLYHVDHIFPRVAFIDYNIDKKYGIKFTKKICNSRENLKIITKEENLLKGGKYNQMDFLFFIQRHIINLKIENTQL